MRARVEKLAALQSDVHVWFIRLDVQPVAHEIEWLSSAEQARAKSFSFIHDQQRFLASHIGLRRVLAHYLDLLPRDVRFVHSSEGKPMFRGGTIGFNLSHSRNVALVAVASGRSVGVDVQHMTPLNNELELAYQQFSESEITLLATRSGDERRDLFYRLWTCREALLKAAGIGLRRGDAEIALTCARVAYIKKRPRELIEKVSLAELSPSEGYAGAVVWPYQSPLQLGQALLFDAAVL